MIDNCFACRFSDWSGPYVQSPTAYCKCWNSNCSLILRLRPDESISYSPKNIGKNHSYECSEEHYMYLIDHRTHLEKIKQFVETNSANKSVDQTYADLLAYMRERRLRGNNVSCQQGPNPQLDQKSKRLQSRCVWSRWSRACWDAGLSRKGSMADMKFIDSERHDIHAYWEQTILKRQQM